MAGCKSLMTLNLADPLDAVGRTQTALLGCAENLLGPRDTRYALLPPVCADGGPRLRFTPDETSVFVELSLNARGYWPTFVFEMAHEVVHLLNPQPGPTTLFEEGLATHFQCVVAPLFSGVEIALTVPTYAAARDAVLALSADPFTLAQRLRERCGSLRALSAADLLALCPAAHPDEAARLAMIGALR
jgi:hypothetical protein